MDHKGFGRDHNGHGGGHGNMPDFSKGKRSPHPGSGRRKALVFPKGRLLNDAERKALREIVGEGPFERALLIEYLHKIQDQEGCLPEGFCTHWQR